MHVYCMRHGETSYNLRTLCNDDPRVEVRLTERGRQQAQTVAAELRDVPLDQILTSELPRTVETARIVNHYHDVPTRQYPGINDIRSGFEGRPVADYFAALAADPLNTRVNGGESLLDHRRRILDFIAWLSGQPWRNVLVVAHEETLRVFHARVHALPAEQLRDLHFGNTAWFEMDL